VNVFQDFDNLWHNNDSFDNLFQNLWDLDDLFYSCVDWNLSLFESVNDLNLVFDIVLGIDNFNNL